MTDLDDIAVLVVDPDPESLEATAAALSGESDLAVTRAADLAGAENVLAGARVDCVVTEYDLADGSGMAVVEAARDHQPDAGCILYTDRPASEVDATAHGPLVAEYLGKDTPGATERLVDLVRNVVVNRTQIGYPIPADEAERLAALEAYSVQDLATAETFDRLTRLMTDHFDVDVAFVGLLDEREERFVACHGADWDTLAREDTVCTHAILETDVTVIEDVQADPRFAANDRLRDLGVAAYAGANITTADGQVIGSLCLIHDEPRGFDERDRHHLRLFADEVTEQLELRRRIAATDAIEELPGEES